MAVKTKIEPYDRVRCAGRTGTALNIHDDKSAAIKRVTVLPDDRPRSAGSEVWRLDDCVRLGRAGRACPRCSQDHEVFYCPEGGPTATFKPNVSPSTKKESLMGTENETNIDNVEGDVVNEAEATEKTTPSETPDANGDTTGDEAQQDTGALQE